MKFSGVGFEKVQAWQKLWPSNFKIGKKLTTFRAYAVKNHYFYEAKVASKTISGIHHPLFGTLGTIQYQDMEFFHSDKLTVQQIRDDTFQWWGRDEFKQLLKVFYGRYDIVGIMVKMEVVDADLQGMQKVMHHLVENSVYLDTLGAVYQ